MNPFASSLVDDRLVAHASSQMANLDFITAQRKKRSRASGQGDGANTHYKRLGRYSPSIYQPGYAFNLIKSGTLIVEDGCGGEETHTAGQAFEEVKAVSIERRISAPRRMS
jgi:hypothetical protein